MQNKLNEVYKLYNEKKYNEAKAIVDNILLSDPENVYAKRYLGLLNPVLGNTHSKEKDGTIAKIKGTKLKCPHCKSSIALSALNSEQKKQIKENTYNNLQLKCPYCNTLFTLQVNNAFSVLGIKIGDTMNYNKKLYRVVGSVKYTGTWEEGVYSGSLDYLEWIVLGSDNSYMYFSEGYFIDDGERNYEYEFSEKITPKFNFSVNYDSKYIEIDNRKIYFSEINKVKAKTLYGENSKVFEVGEEVMLYEFSYNGEDYVLEKEKAGRQAEAGIYKTKSISLKAAGNYFGKDVENAPGDNAGKAFGGIIIFIVLLPIFVSFVVYPIGNLIFESKREVQLQNIGEGKKFQIDFRNPALLNEVQDGEPIKYDYGGVKTTYKKNTGLQFSVRDETDKMIIQKIQEKIDNDSDISTLFKEKIYQLK